MLDDDDSDLTHVPATALAVTEVLANQLRAVDNYLAMIDEHIEVWRKASAQALKSI